MLNILQSVAAAYDSCNEDTIYTCVGAPRPADMMKIVDWMFNEDFQIAFSSN